MRTDFDLPHYSPVPVAIIQRDLQELEERAACIHLSIAKLAKRGGVRLSLLSQWKGGSTVVTGQTYCRHRRRLWQALEAEEAELLEYLRRVTRRAA